jgi:Protein of unknown function (DUF1592)/Protein of unknown function (DUF1588)/Protein of unknown function (DUF1595)/Protein of unknown function (DUF1585)/Protein of unknown function (DUF1587)
MRARPLSVPSLAAIGCGLAFFACSGEIDAPSGPPAQTRPDAPRADVGGPAQVDGSAQPAADGGGPNPLALACDAPSSATTPLQRLTRRQYRNSVNDVFAIAFDSSTIAGDEKVGSFSANTVAPLSELSVEQYMDAAESVAKLALDKLPMLISCDFGKDESGCASTFIAQVGRRLYRRPLIAEESARYVGLFQACLSGSDYRDALRVVTQTMLQSPNFLYRLELSDAPQGSGDVVQLGPYELASRLAFFLTASAPDDALLDAARDGKLDDASGLAEEASRLLDDVRSNAAIEAFHFEWLELDDLAQLEKDATVYPGFDDSFRQAMHDETAHFVDYVIRDGDAKLDSLLTAPYSFPSGPLLGLYGVTSSDASKPVQLDAGQRAGLLTQPAFLSVHAHANQTGPVQRGKFVIRNMLCEALPDPPPNVNTTPPDPSPTATTRERLAEHESNASCSGCHVRMDGIGLGFERYDGIGRYRTTEAGQTIDESGKLVGTRDLDGPFVGPVDLAKKLASSSEVAECVTLQWFRFALGRLEGDQDACSLLKLKSQFSASGRDVKALMKQVVSSDAFRTKRVSAP